MEVQHLEEECIHDAWIPESVGVCGAVSSAAVGPLGFLKSTVRAEIYQEIPAALCWLAVWT